MRFTSVLRFFDYLARFSVFAMMGLVVADVLIRKPIRPIPGTYDLVSFLGVAVVAFAIPYSVASKGHVQVELFVSRLPRRLQAAIDVATGLFSLFFFTLVCWQCFSFAMDIRKAGEVSMSAHFPFYPFILLISLMCGFACAVLAIEVAKAAHRILRP